MQAGRRRSSSKGLCADGFGRISPKTRSHSVQPWTRTFLAHDVPHQPGTRFVYNTPATHMVSAIVQKQTGQTVLDYLRPRLLEPLGIEERWWPLRAE
ncbi:MAG: hypothetical protein FJ276_10660 [Planctomycetes bacterium]|nr:hypothetical protein [Planctomycetota bacterium]